MTSPLAYLNGRFIPAHDAILSWHDAGFVMGATVTDLCRTFSHQLFRLPEHVARFRQSCDLARVPLEATDAELTARALELTAHNAALVAPEQELSLVFLATPGPIGFYAGDPDGVAVPTLGMHTFPLPTARYRHLFEQGAHLVTPPTRQPPASTIDPRIKQHSRLHWWIADQEAKAIDPAASALLLDQAGHVTETAAANFLAVRDGTVLSPSHGSILDGISLRVVREMCRALGIPFAERPIALDDALSAEECFLTNTNFCLAGVSRINGHPIPWPGPVTEKLRKGVGSLCWPG